MQIKKKNLFQYERRVVRSQASFEGARRYISTVKPEGWGLCGHKKEHRSRRTAGALGIDGGRE